MFTIDNFVIGLKNSFPNIEVTMYDGKLLLSRLARNGNLTEKENELLGEIPITEVHTIIDDVANGFTFNDYILYEKVSFEVPIQSQDRMRLPSYRFFDR